MTKFQLSKFRHFFFSIKAPSKKLLQCLLCDYLLTHFSIIWNETIHVTGIHVLNWPIYDFSNWAIFSEGSKYFESVQFYAVQLKSVWSEVLCWPTFYKLVMIRKYEEQNKKVLSEYLAHPPASLHPQNKNTFTGTLALRWSEKHMNSTMEISAKRIL